MQVRRIKEWNWETEKYKRGKMHGNKNAKKDELGRNESTG